MKYSASGEGPLPTECISAQLDFEGIGRRHVATGFGSGTITWDANGLVLREIDRALGPIQWIAACLRDARAPRQVVRGLPTLVS